MPDPQLPSFDLADPTANIRPFHGDFGPREQIRLTKAASPQSRNESGIGANIYEEYGRSGLRHWGGFVFEEWLRELQQGQRAAQVYRDMMDSDPMIGAIMYAITMLCRRVTWWVEPADTTKLAEGASAREAKKGAEWFDGVLHDMRFSWDDTISEILSFLGYGWSYHEEVYKLRRGDSRNRLESSKYDDGTIGLAKLPLRAQDSIWKWVFDDVGEIEGMIQNPPPDYLLRFVPMEKAILFRTTIFKDNPEGRPLVLDTPLKTTDGWKTMGTVAVGDMVYDEVGASRRVVGKSRVFTDRPVYEVEFSSGHVVVADAVHEWEVTTTADRTYGKKRVLTTEQMLDLMQQPNDPHLCCGIAPTLDIPEADLPLDPYLLGYWLGDGATGRAAFSVSDFDMPHLKREVERAGFFGKRTGREYYFTVRGGFLDGLRRASVVTAKHIPRQYLEANAAQRLALLQGLMDSDGFSPATHAKDQASKFANTDIGLIEGVCELVRSLGGQPRVRIMERAGSPGGSPKGRVIVGTKDVHEVAFYLPACVHRLPRKAARQQLRGTLKSCGHFVKAIRSAGTANTVCIEVDSPSHLFLAGRGLVPTHNSILRNAYRSWYFLKNIQNIEGIGLERDLAGLPMLQPPEGVDIWDTNDPAMAPILAAAQNVVSSIRRDEQEGVIIPFGWTLSLLSTGGQRQFDTSAIITRYETRIATSVLADLVMMGQNSVGSYALAVTKKDLFSASLGAFLDIVANQFNTETIPRLWRLNGFTGPHPKLMHGTVETIDLDTLGNYIMRLGQSGAPIDWETVLPWTMGQAGIPKPKDGHDFTPRPAARSISDAGAATRPTPATGP